MLAFLLDNHQWWNWFNYWMNQNADNWLPISSAVDQNPLVIGLHLVGNILISLSFFVMGILFIQLSKKQGFLSKAHKLSSWFFVIFIFLCGIVFIFRDIVFFIPIFWITGAVLLITGVFSVMTTILYAKAMPYILAVPTSKELNDLKEQKEELERKTKLLNSHIDTWRGDVGYHINLLKGQQKRLAEDLIDKGVSVTLLENIHESYTPEKKAEALKSLETIKDELDNLAANVLDIKSIE